MPITVTDITDAEAKTLLGIEESHFVDLKSKEIAPAKVTRSVSAFANASGGELFIGVEERIGAEGQERIWRGFGDQEDANGLIQALEMLAPLANHYSMEFLRNPKCTGLVAHVTVFKSKQILLASDGKAYVRRGAQKLPVEGPEAFKRLEYDKGVASFEDELIDLELPEVSNSTTVIEFMLTTVPSGEPDQWLQKQRVVRDGRPTVAAVLLFADEPQAVLPKRSAVKILRYKTKAEGDRDTLVFDPITMEGPLFEVIYASVEKCKGIIEGVQKLGTNGMEAVVYPDEALHEIITNAILHRDYSIPADVQVRIFDDRVEIESPGRLPGHVSVQNILKEQSARNPKIVRLINKFPNAPNKDVGEGLNTAFEAMGKLRLKAPIIQELDNSVLVTLRHESLGSPEQLVLEYLQSHSEVTNSIARDLTGIKSENTMKEVFYRLRDRGVLEQVPEKLGNKAAWRRRE
jgi:ATP-dependent DNA helicase RecG